METTKPSSSGIAFKWAVINVITSIIITYIFQLMGTGIQAPARYLAYIPFIAFLCLGQKEYRDKLSGFMTYGEGFVEGLLYGVFSGIMMAIFIYVYYSFLYPQAIDQIVAAARDSMVAKGTPSDQMDTALDVTRKYGAIFALVGALFVTPIFAMIIALITAAIFKKEPTIQDIENRQTDPTV
jgi:hypothetical protein